MARRKPAPPRTSSSKTRPARPPAAAPRSSSPARGRRAAPNPAAKKTVKASNATTPAPARGRTTAPRAKATSKAKTAPRPKARAAKTATPAAPKTRRARPAARPAPAPKSAPPAATRPRRRAGTSTPPPRPPILDLDPEEDGPTEPSSSLDVDHGRAPRRVQTSAEEEPLHLNASADAALTAGDVDADWQSAATVGDEAPGGDNPTPDQDVVDLIGKSLGIEYQDDQELQGGDEIVERDKKRWELDPASSDDWKDRKK